MGIVKQEQIWLYITDLIKHADKEFLKLTDNKSKLIERLSNELFFIGAYTRAVLNSQVIPFMEKNAEDIYSMKELVLQKPVAKKKITAKKPTAAKKKATEKKKPVAKKKIAAKKKPAAKKRVSAMKKPATKPRRKQLQRRCPRCQRLLRTKQQQRI